MTVKDLSDLFDFISCGTAFFGFFMGLIAPKFCKLLNLSIKFLSKKLGKDKKEKEKKDEK